MGKFVRTLFSKLGMALIAYVVIGIAYGPPPGQAGKLPLFQDITAATILAWGQFLVWVVLWPIGVIFHHPAISL